ncbi:MAG: hemolysin family protein [Aeromonas sp.]
MMLVILLGLILANGLFALAEIALVTARKGRLRHWASQQRTGAKRALALNQEPTALLSAVQVGITSIGLLSGIFGEALLAAPLAEWLQSLGLAARHASGLATLLVVVSITYLAIVLGELIPKRVGQMHAEVLACWLAPLMHGVIRLTRPLVWLLTRSTDWGLRVLRITPSAHASVTQEEIHDLLSEGSAAGIIEDEEHALLRNVFRLDDRPLSALMVPRSEMHVLDLTWPLAKNLQRIRRYGHHVWPVCDGGLSNVVGVLDISQLLDCYLQQQALDLAALTKDAHLLPETLHGLDLLQHFRRHREPMALVVDEYGELQGLVTRQDLLESLAGDFTPRDEASACFLRTDGSWLLDGRLTLPELKDCLGLSQLPEEAGHHYHTLAGLLLLLHGRIPAVGDVATLAHFQLEVVDMDGLRIDKVLATPHAAGAPPPIKEL